MPRAISTTFIWKSVSKGRGTEQASDDIDTMNDSLDQTAESADDASTSSDKATKSIGGMGKAAGTAGKLLAGGLVAGLGAVAAVVAKDFSELNKSMAMFSARTGTSGAELSEFKDIAKDVFTAGLGDDLNDVVQTMTQVNAVTGAAGDTLESLTKNTEIFTDVFGKDVNETIRAADTVMDNFGTTSDDTFDLLTKSIQATGDPADDLLDTFNEYSANFADLGFTADEMFSILESGLKAGARNTDDIADGMREFGIRLKDGSSDLALWELGLSGVNQEFKAGKISGEDMFNAALQGLRDIEDPIKRNEAGVALFGTKWEDVGEQAFLALDTTSESLKDMEGSTQRAGEALRRGPVAQFRRFTRVLRMKGVDLMTEGLGRLVEFINDVTDVLGPLIFIARKFGIESPQFFGILTKFFGPDKAKQIQNFVIQVRDALTSIGDLGKKVAEGMVNLGRDIVAAFTDGGLAEVGKTILNKIAGGIADLAAWVKTNIVDKIVLALTEVDWSVIPASLSKILSFLFTGAVSFADTVTETLVDPIVATVTVIDWSVIPGRLAIILDTLLAMGKPLLGMINEKIVNPIVKTLGGIDWSTITGVLDTIMGAVMTGTKSVPDLALENIVNPLLDAISGEGEGNTVVQAISQKAGELTRLIIEGIASAAATAKAFIEAEGLGIAAKILGGIALAFVGISAWLATNVIDPFILGLTGQNLEGLVTKGGVAAAEFLSGFAAQFTVENVKAAITSLATNLGGEVSGLVTAGGNAAKDFLSGFVAKIAETDWVAMAEGFLNFGIEIAIKIAEGLAGLGSQLIDILNDAIPDEIGLGEHVIFADTPFQKTFGINFDLPNNPIPGGSRDQGGRVSPGRSFQIGQGPFKEFFVPDQPGRIFTPGQMAGAGGGMTFNGNMVFPGVTDTRSMQRELEGLDQRQNRSSARRARG
jgi:hypothetical protein